MHIFSIQRLVLSHFRNYESLRLELTPQPVIITGNNGAGKTNILEAVSFLSPGRGLRSAALDTIDRQTNHPLPWGISATVYGTDGIAEIGTGRLADRHTNKRVVKLNGQPLRGHAELSSLLSVIWLTPQMDPLFIEGASGRRKFLDRLVFNFDTSHASQVAAYEHAMRERARLLKEGRADPHWLAILEKKMAETGVAIAAARRLTVGYLQQTIHEATGPFPKASLSLSGLVEEALNDKKALEVEEWLINELKNARSHDMQTGRTHIGIHRSDLLVVHTEKQMAAEFCSTGEQKALLISIILAEAKARMTWRHSVPILLLDEIVAHLDSNRRTALFEDILAMGAQAWITGTDEAIFAPLRDKAQFLRIDQGVIHPTPANSGL